MQTVSTHQTLPLEFFYPVFLFMHVFLLLSPFFFFESMREQIFVRVVFPVVGSPAPQVHGVPQLVEADLGYDWTYTTRFRGTVGPVDEEKVG